jgi:3-oxoacyl-[acyl-carrier-protein] synthase-1
MRRVVVTGLGIISCLGNDKKSVIESLHDGRSGIRFNQEYCDMGLRSQVSGSVNLDIAEHVDRKHLRMMGDAAGFSYIAMRDAIADAGLADNLVSNVRTGLIVGSGGASNQNIIESADILRNRGIRKVGPFRVPRSMGSTTSACLSTFYQIKGVNYSITSACATSAHCIGAAMEQIQLNKQDVMFAGGGEEEHWSLTMMFDAMGALSAGRNDDPTHASRPFDVDRDGFISAGGAGILVLEELEHARRRGAKIYAELVGYGATSDGYDMVAPSGEGAARCMQQAMATVDSKIDYINAHGTSTPAGDSAELKAVKEVFGASCPKMTSTKSLTGHSLGAAGAQEAIYSLLMLENDFIAGSVNIENLDPAAEGIPIPQQTIENAGLTTVMSNSFGFGGTNATLVLRKLNGT